LGEPVSTLIDVLILFGMGLIGGAVGAVAGGAGLFTFPALLYVGLNPVVASASNFVALTPSGITAALATRRQLVRTRGRFLRLLPTIFIGSTLGAVLLVSIPVPTFSKIFPVLLLGATILFATAPKLQPAVGTQPASSRLAQFMREHGLLFFAAVYGGFFGAGVGIILLTALMLAGWRDVRQANAVKNLSITVASFGSIAIFVAGDSIQWREALIVMAGAAVGGYLGGAISQKVGEVWIRRIVVAVGGLLSVYYGADHMPGLG
jgi:hypothetical protein